MVRYIGCLVLGVLLFSSNGNVHAQLFKGRAQRQSGGGSNNAGRQQSRGGLFQRGRERRAENAAQSSNQSRNNGSMQKSGGGLFGRADEKREKGGGLFNKNRSTQSSSGQEKEKNGLFARARQRKQDRQIDSQPQARQQPYSQSNSEKSVSYVRSNQRVTSEASLFKQQPVTNDQPSPAKATLAAGRASPQRVQAKVSGPRPASRDSDRPQLPSLVKASTPQVRRPPRRSPADQAPAAFGVPGRRRGPQRAALDPSKLRKVAPNEPEAQPTGNLPNLEQPKNEPTDAVLADCDNHSEVVAA